MSSIKYINGSHFSNTKRLSDIEFETSLHLEPVNYESGDGFLPIDKRIVRNIDGNFWGINASSLITRIARKTGSFPDVALTNRLDASKLGFSLEGANESTAIAINENTVVFPDVFPEVDWHLISKPDSLKSTIEIKSVNSPCVKRSQDKLLATFAFKLKKLGKGIVIKSFKAFDVINSQIPMDVEQTERRIVCVANVTNSIFPVYIDPTSTVQFTNNAQFGYAQRVGALYSVNTFGDPSYSTIAGRVSTTYRRMFCEFPISSFPWPYRSIDSVGFNFNINVLIDMQDCDFFGYERQYGGTCTGGNLSAEELYNAIGVGSANSDLRYYDDWTPNLGDEELSFNSTTNSRIDERIECYNDGGVPGWGCGDRFVISTLHSGLSGEYYQLLFDRAGVSDWAPPVLKVGWTRRVVSLT